MSSIQGFRKVVVELWVVSESMLARKHRCGQRVIDIYSVIMARRKYGCIKREDFTFAVKPDGSDDAKVFANGTVTLSCQYKIDAERFCEQHIDILEVGRLLSVQD